MISSSARRVPRFPVRRETIGTAEISAAFDRIDVGPHDLALTQAACDGDLLLPEACQAGVGTLRFLCLWDGSSDDRAAQPRCTQVKRRTSRICWIDTRTL